VAYDLVALGGALIQQGKSVDALPLIQRALDLRIATKQGDLYISEARFYLAQAQWEIGKDRRGALELARSARPGYVAGGPGVAGELKKLDRWLKGKRG
jgi:hypothetical protein